VKKALIGLVIVGGIAALVLWDLLSQGAVECSLCVNYKGRNQCAVARAPTEEKAREEAQRSACSQITSGVTEAFACPNVPPHAVECK
jgi:hypothetical protein